MKLCFIVFVVFAIFANPVLGRSKFGSIINHVFSCDCFIRNNYGNSLDEILQSLNFESKVTNTKLHPNLFVVHPTRDSTPTSPPLPSTPPAGEEHSPTKKNESLLSSLLALIKESQQKLQELGWIQADQDVPKEAPPQPPVIQATAETSNLFSIEQGSITRNVVRIGRFLQLFDKFDCRCAGDLSSLINAKRFVRFTVAHA